MANLTRSLLPAAPVLPVTVEPGRQEPTSGTARPGVGSTAPFGWLIEYGTLVYRDGVVICLLPANDEFAQIDGVWHYRPQHAVRWERVTSAGTRAALNNWLHNRSTWGTP